MVKALKYFAIAASLSTLTGCVTQNYENSKTPVVENDSSNTDIAMTRVSLGLGYLKMGNTTQAKLNLEKAKRFAPDLVQVYTAFAHYYETVGEDDLTVNSYEKALSLKPDDADTLNNYGVFLCRKDRLPEAEIQFLRAIAVPSYLLVSQSYENLALCQLRAPNFEKAETYLAKAIDHNPSNASSLYQMMRLQYAKGEFEKALAYSRRFEKATRRFNPDSLSLSYKIYQKLGDERIAKNYGSMLVKMFPESYQAKQFLLNELAQIEADQLAEKYQLLKIGSYEKAAPKRVVKISPNNKPAFNLKLKRDLIASGDEQAKMTTAKPIKKTVVLKSSKPKTVPVSEPIVEEVVKQPAVESAAQEVAVVTEQELGGSAAEALALAQAELAAIDAQLDAQLNNELNEGGAGELATVEPEPAESHAAETDVESLNELQDESEITSELEPVVEGTNDKALTAQETLLDDAAVNTAETEFVAATEQILEQNVEQTDELANQLTTELEDSVDAVNSSEDASEFSPELVAEASDTADSELSVASEQINTEVASFEPQNQDMLSEETAELLVDVSETNTSDDALVVATDLVTDESTVDEFFEGSVEQNAEQSPEQNTEVNELLADESVFTVTDESAAMVDEDEVTDNVEVITEDSEQVGELEAEPVYESLEELPQHVIEKGENLFAVSRRYNIRLNTLIKWNDLDERALVKVGDIIYLADPSVVKQVEEQ